MKLQREAAIDMQEKIMADGFCEVPVDGPPPAPWMTERRFCFEVTRRNLDKIGHLNRSPNEVHRRPCALGEHLLGEWPFVSRKGRRGQCGSSITKIDVVHKSSWQVASRTQLKKL